MSQVKKLQEKFNSLPGWGQAVVVIFILFVIYYTWNWLMGFIDGVKNQSGSKGEISALNAQGIKASYADSKYVQLADDLQTAIEGMGTDEEAVYDVMRQMNNDVDVIKLTDAFSVRDEENLKQWLRGDLDGDEMSVVNEILANKNITRRF